MIIVNLSKPKNYYKQTNNEIKPLIRCKPTATVECLDIAGYRPEQFITGKFKQPEDNLTAYLEEKYGENAPEDWDKIVQGIKRFYGESICKFHGNLTEKQILEGLDKGNPFAVSTRLTRGGHVVSVVGYEAMNEQHSTLTAWIIDDPYGKWTSGVYDKEQSGYNQRYTPAIFHN